MSTQGFVANPQNNPVLQQSASLSSSILDWSTTISQSATNLIGVLEAWNNASNAQAVQVPNTINNTAAQSTDDKLQKGFFYVGVALVFVAGGVWLYKTI